MEVRNVLIVANANKDGCKGILEGITKYLRRHHIKSNVVMTGHALDEIKVPEDADLVVSIGGDGTVLSCARSVHDLGIPIIAVNLGTFGYITEIGNDEWEDAFDSLLKGEERISRRLMIRVSVHRGSQRVFQASGLNEMVITAQGIAKIVKLDLSINSTFAGRFRSDGMIIATPTGSTGYSLAAGGPIVDSELSALIVTPICPFTLSNRPLVLGGNDVISVTVTPEQRTNLILTVDGQVEFPLEEGDLVVCEKSRSKVLLVSSTKRNHTEVIRTKLNWSGEMHA